MTLSIRTLAAALCLGAAGFAAPAGADVRYEIDLTRPLHHMGLVRIVFPAADGETLDVSMPAWRTGRYEILDLARGVRGFSATDGNGRPLAFRKIDKSTWRIQRTPGSTVTVRYELYGNELNQRVRHIDDSHAFLDASGVFLYAERHRAEPVEVALKLPSGWRADSGMASSGPARFAAPNWDVLVDSPIEAGTHRIRTFRADGRDYELAIWGEGKIDGDRLARELQAMVPTSQTIWKGYPFQRYLFIYHVNGGTGGATEHLNSTVIQMDAPLTKDPEAYRALLKTSAHEFAHTWNVKAYRNAAMVPYRYGAENYTDLLWVEEGSTDYFSDHMALRAGLMSEAQYFADLAAAIEANKARFGRFQQSVAEASFDQWIQPGGDRAQNASVDIYSEGSLVSLALDLALLDQSDGRLSYRDVHQALYRRFDSSKVGFTASDMKAILRELTGRSWDEWWAKHVDAPVDLDVDAMLATVGLALDRGGPMVRAAAGWTGSPDEKGIRLDGVDRNGAAWNAGLTTGDVVTAVGGRAATKADWFKLLSANRPGEKVTVDFLRRGEPRRVVMTLGARGEKPFAIHALAAPTARQKKLFERWLLMPFPSA